MTGRQLLYQAAQDLFIIAALVGIGIATPPAPREPGIVEIEKQGAELDLKIAQVRAVESLRDVMP